MNNTGISTIKKLRIWPMRSHKPWTFNSFFTCLRLLISEGTRWASPHFKKIITCHNIRELQFASICFHSFHLNGTHTLPKKTKSVWNLNFQTDFASLKQFVYRSSQHYGGRKQQLAQTLYARRSALSNE